MSLGEISGDRDRSGGAAQVVLRMQAHLRSFPRQLAQRRRWLPRIAWTPGVVKGVLFVEGLYVAGKKELLTSGDSQYASITQNLGSVPRRCGRFTFQAVTANALIVGKPVKIWQAVGPYPGKGTREDECEMDHVSATGIVTQTSDNTATITVYWSSPTRVRGERKFNYLAGG
jgi:hypothetical protein